MTLTLYMHPLASFCHKVLIALFENDTRFIAETVDLGDTGSTAAHLERWPVGKMPVLHASANDTTIPETSIIIEYLDRHYPGPSPMLPQDPDTCLQVRLWDRFFDLYVSTPMQTIVGDRLRPEGHKDPRGVDSACATLDTAYGMIEKQVSADGWAADKSFSMADCSAAPALFFASIVHPFDEKHTNLAAYFDRLMGRPSVERVIAEARPFFPMFPYSEAIPPRFLAENER
ncbi:glutathione S-transferase family protein [Chelativorans sp. YIM 93263]|uniref:glutathione S-transferase family protein n=1 Tax=Chelativorans sp. YIM 93263 TaxID=2906648 RepID=UPI002378DC64|nr:glutathione S-transferase family protein [Chelativorans sp. YIM 93263]